MPGSAQRDPTAAQRWVFTLTVGFLCAATVMRSVLEFEGGQLALVLALVGVWAGLVAAAAPLSRGRPPVFVAYLVLQAAVIAVLLGQSDGSDYFAILLAVPSMQAMERWRPRAALALIAAFAALFAASVVAAIGAGQAAALAAVYTAANLVLASYALTARRATEARVRNEALAADLREANQRLVESARQAERLAAARERQRLARDLHDSVTQTLFSLTLAAGSATLLLQRRPQALASQLDQIEQLATSARSELDALGAELPGAPAEGEGLVASLRRHLGERAAQDGLRVALEVEGDRVLAPGVEGERRLAPGVEVALLRIVQEALNNVVKHAGVAEAEVRLRLDRPATVEVRDRGCGFAADGVRRTQGAPGGTPRDASRALPEERPGVGLAIMRERAAEIGWRLTVTSAPGSGTRVVAEEGGDEGG